MEDLLFSLAFIPYVKVEHTAAERHRNAAAMLLLIYTASLVPLGVSEVSAPEWTSGVSFERAGTLMSLGTGPFNTASVIAPLLFTARRRERALLGGLALSAVYALGALGASAEAALLCAAAWLLMNAMRWTDDHGSVSISTGLVCCQASSTLVLAAFQDPLRLAWTALLAMVMIFLTGCAVGFPMAHETVRNGVRATLPLLYNGTSPIVMGHMLAAFAGRLGAPTLPVILGGIVGFSILLPGVEERTARDVIRQWKERKLSLRGWRSAPTKMVARAIRGLVGVSAAALCALCALQALARPAVPVSTLAILLSTADTHLKEFDEGGFARMPRAPWRRRPRAP